MVFDVLCVSEGIVIIVILGKSKKKKPGAFLNAKPTKEIEP